MFLDRLVVPSNVLEEEYFISYGRCRYTDLIKSVSGQTVVPLLYDLLDLREDQGFETLTLVSVTERQSKGKQIKVRLGPFLHYTVPTGLWGKPED